MPVRSREVLPQMPLQLRMVASGQRFRAGHGTARRDVNANMAPSIFMLSLLVDLSDRSRRVLEDLAEQLHAQCPGGPRRSQQKCPGGPRRASSHSVSWWTSPIAAEMSWWTSQIAADSRAGAPPQCRSLNRTLSRPLPRAPVQVTQQGVGQTPAAPERPLRCSGGHRDASISAWRRERRFRDAFSACNILVNWVNG